MSKVFYYLFLIPLSYLPLSILYLLCPFIYFILLYVISYRKSVVFQNISNSYPSNSFQENQVIMKGFYMHLSMLLVEGIKNLTISKVELSNRVLYKNPELVTELTSKGRNVILVSGHYGNWEWIITSLGIHFPKNLFGLGMPMSKSFWDHKINSKRQRFGLKVIHSKNHKESLNDKNTHPFVILMLSDQSPGDSNKSYWMDFLHQKTAVQFGTETMANEYDASVIYYHIRKVKPGKIEVEFEPISNNPLTEKYGNITESFTKLLEMDILKHPEFWMWSHKRWKRAVPENLANLVEELASKFQKKYR